MSDADLKQELERLKLENTTLKGRSAGALSLKISTKGGLSVYGLGRFPVTLYKEQWRKLLAVRSELEAFMLEHEGELKSKE